MVAILGSNASGETSAMVSNYILKFLIAFICIILNFIAKIASKPNQNLFDFSASMISKISLTAKDFFFSVCAISNRIIYMTFLTFCFSFLFRALISNVSHHYEDLTNWLWLTPVIYIFNAYETLFVYDK